MTLSNLDHEHPRVRYAAIHCIAQLSTDFQPTIQKVYNEKIIPALIMAMGDKVPKVQSHAATAVVNFVEDCDKKYVTKYLDKLLLKLLELLKKGKRHVQEQSLSAISAIADCAKDSFTKYYNYIMPLLYQILTNAKGKDDVLLLSRAIECTSLIGVAVGKDIFGKDSEKFIEILVNLQKMEESVSDNLLTKYILQVNNNLIIRDGQESQNV
jgi:hypothetical protein